MPKQPDPTPQPEPPPAEPQGLEALGNLLESQWDTISADQADGADLDEPDPKPASAAPPPPPAPPSAKPTTPEPAKPKEPAKVEDFNFKDPPIGEPYDARKRTAEHWEAVNNKARGLAQQLESAKAELAKSKGNGDAAALRQELETYKKELQAIAVERDPEFQRRYTQASRPLEALARSAVGADKAEQVAKLLQQAPSAQRDQAIDTLADGLSQAQTTRLYHAVAQLDTLAFQKQQEVEAARENWQNQISQGNTKAEREAAVLQERRQAVFNDVLSKWSDPDQGYIFFQKTGDAEHDAAVTRRIQTAQAAFNGELPVEHQPGAALWMALGPDLASANIQLQQQLQEANDQLGKLRSKQPAGTSRDAAAVPDQEPISGESYAEKILNSWYKEQGAIHSR